MWDTGHALQWSFRDTNKKGYALYSGKPMEPGRKYHCKVMAWVGSGWGEPADWSEPFAFMAPPALPDAREELKRLVFGEKLDSLYIGTLNSLTDRIRPNGHAPTSLTSSYPGQFVRDSSAQIFAHLAVGDLESGKKVLEYLLRRHLELGLVQRAAHVVNNREDDRGLDIAYMEDQPEGNYHLVIAYARSYAKRMTGSLRAGITRSSAALRTIISAKGISRRNADCC